MKKNKFICWLIVAIMTISWTVQGASAFADAPSGQELLLEDRVCNTSQMYDSYGWGTAGWSLWQLIGCESAQDVLYVKGEDTYATYAAYGLPDIAEAKLRVAMERSLFSYSEDNMKNTCANGIYSSEDGKNFERVDHLNITFQKVATTDSGKKTIFDVDILLPAGIKYLKIMPGCAAEWAFFLSGVKLYGAKFDYASIGSIYKTHEGMFDVGVSVEPTQMEKYKDLILSQYNEIVIENQMKPYCIHPSENVYDFSGADAIVEFAQKNGLKVRGHGLVYEKLFPAWFTQNEDGSTASYETVMQRLEDHVRTIVRHFKGKIYCYDVVNELFGHVSWDIRDVAKIVGPENLIANVFQWAHEEDPDAILILNDNYYDIPSKRQLIFNTVKKLIDQGVPIQGVGFQDHHFIDTDVEDIDAALTLFEQIPGLKLYITELDVRAYESQDTTTIYPDYMNEELKELVARKYASIFDIYRKHADRIEAVDLWNITTRESWTNDLVAGRYNNFANLFDDLAAPLPAYNRVIDTKGELPRWDGGTMPAQIRNNNYTIDSQRDVITIKGTAAGDVTASLSSNFGVKSDIASKTVSGGGEYEIELSLNTDTMYNTGLSPDYILEVTDDNGTKTDSFTYYTVLQRNLYYTVTDSLEDFRKVYRAKKCMLENKPSSFDGDENVARSLRFWSESATFGNGEIVYKIPDGFHADTFSFEMYTPTFGSWFSVYYSGDDVSYSQLSVDYEALYSGNSSMQHVRGTVSEIPDSARYIKIDLEQYKYLSNVRLTTTTSGPGLLISDKVADTSNMSDHQDWGIAPIGWAYYNKVGVKNPQDIYYAKGKDTYAVYTRNNKDFTRAEISLAFERSVFDWNSEKILDVIRNAFLVSGNGVDFWRVNQSDISISDPVTADEGKKYLYTVEIKLPEGVTHFKIMPGVENEWAVFLTGVNLFGIDQTVKEFRTDSVRLKVNGESVLQPASGTLSAEWTVKRSGIGTVSPAMVMAVYDANGKLKCCAKAENTFYGSGVLTFTASKDGYTYESGDLVRCMLFESLGGLHPLFGAVNFE